VMCNADAVYQGCNGNERVAQRNRNGQGSSSLDNFGSLLRLFIMSIEEVWRRGKRRDGKVSVLNCLTVFHGQTVGKCKGMSGNGCQSASATVFVEEEGREGGFGKAYAHVQ